MRKRRILSLLLAVAVMATMLVAVPLTASASTVDDLVEITENMKFYADKLNNGAGLTGGTLYSDGHILSIGDNSYGTKNNEHDIDGVKFKNNLRLKGTSSIIAFKVKSGAHVVIYHENHKERSVAAGTVNPKTDTNNFLGSVIASSALKSDSFEFDVKSDSTIYLTGVLKSGDVLSAPNNSSGDIYIGGIFVTYAATKPTISLNYKDVKLATGNTITLTPSFELMDGISAQDVQWESDQPDYASVVGGVVTGKAPGSAVITAKVNYGGSYYTATCNVTVANAIDLTLLFNKGVSQVKIKSSDNGGKEYTVTPASPKIEDLPFGQYNLEYTNGAPVTFDISELPTTLTVDKDTPTTLNVDAAYHTATNVFSEEIYNAMKGHTVFWGSSNNKWVPSSMANLNLIQQKDIVPIAGSIDNATEDSKVYMTVQNGKLDFSNRTGNFQYNEGTILTVPVVPGSVITIINYSNSNDNHNTVYTITDSTGASETVGTMTADGQKEESYVYEKKYLYQGATNGYVTITAVEKSEGGYLTSIAVDATVNLTDYFGKGLTDKGFYYKDEDYNNKLGVIRFLQSVQNVEITEFGFYIVKGSDASIIQTQKTEVSSTEQAEAVMNNGFFTDVFGIPSGETAACLAVPFVKLKDGEKVVTGMAIQASMSEDDWNREVEFTEPTPSE